MKQKQYLPIEKYQPEHKKFIQKENKGKLGIILLAPFIFIACALETWEEIRKENKELKKRLKEEKEIKILG